MDLAFDVENVKAGYFKLPEYQKILVSFSVVLIVAGLYIYLLYMPMLESLGGLEKKLSDLQTKVSQVRAVARELPKFEEEHKKVKERLARALTQLPGSDEIPKLLKDMETLGRSAGVEFVSISLKKEKLKSFYAEVPIALTMVGIYHDVAVFFDKLSKLPRIVNVSKIAIAKPKMLEGRLVLSLNCVATTYKFIEKKVEKGRKR